MSRTKRLPPRPTVGQRAWKPAIKAPRTVRTTALNVRLLAVTAVVVVAGAIGASLWHAYQARHNASALLDRASALEASGDWRGAVEQVFRYVKLQPNDVAARIRLAQDFDRSADEPQSQARAAELYAHALGLAPDRSDLRQRQAELALQAGSFAAAEEQSRAILARDPANGAALRILAVAFHERTRGTGLASSSEIVDAYEKALLANPADVELVERLARLYCDEQKSGDNAEGTRQAEDLLAQLFQRSSETAQGLLARHRLRSDYHLPGADEDLLRALAVSPNDAEVLLAAGEHALRNRQARQARDYFERVRTIQPNNWRGHSGLAVSLLALNEPARVVEILEKPLKQSQTTDIIMGAQLAEALILVDRLDDAKQWIDRLDVAISTLEPQLRPASRLDLRGDYHLLVAKWHMARQEPGQAAEFLQRIVTTPALGTVSDSAVVRHAHAWARLGQCRSALAQWDLAAKAYEQAVALQPSSAPLMQLLAESEQLAGQYGRAAQILEAGARLPGAPPTMFVQLARAILREQLARPAAERDWVALENALTNARHAAPDSAALTFVQADFLDASGHTPDAIELVAAKERDMADDRGWWTSAALAYERWQRPNDADRACGRLLQLVGQTDDYLLLRSRVLESRGDLAEARSLLESAMEQAEPDRQVALALRLVEIATDGSQSGRLQNRIARLSEQFPTHLQLATAAAELSLDAKDWATFVAALQRLKGIEGEDGCLWRDLSIRRVMMEARVPSRGQLAQMERLVSEISARRPQWARASALQGQLALLRSKPDEAIDAFTQAIRLGERDVRLFQGLIALLFDQNRVAEAQSYLDQLSGVGIATPAASLAGVSAYVRGGQVDRAVALARQTAEQNPGDIMSQIWYAQTLALAGNTKPAVSHLRTVVDKTSDDPRGWLALFGILLRIDRAAARELLPTIGENSALADPQRQVVLAQCYALLGEREQAQKHYDEATRLAPNDADIRRQVAAFLAAENPASAERMLRESLERSPNDDASRRILATILGMRGGEDAWQEGWKLLEHADSEGSTAAANRRAKALLLLRRGTPENRRRALELLEQTRFSRATLTDSDRLMLARLYEEDDRLHDAEEQWRSLVEGPNSAVEHLALFCDFLLRHDRADDAAAVVERIDAVAKNTLIAVSRRAHWLALRQSHAQIEPLIAEFLQASTVAVSPERQVQLVGQVADLYASVGLTQLAERSFRQLVALDARQYPRLAHFLAKQDRLPEAVGACGNQAGEAADARAAALVCSLLAEYGATSAIAAAAEPMVAKALLRYPDDEQLSYHAATLRHLQERTTEAAGIYRRVLTLNPKHTSALNNLAELLSELPAQRKEAAELIERALEIAGPEPGLLDTKGMVLLRSDDAQQAVEVLRQAAQPGADPRFYFHLALAYHRIGNEEQARDALAEAQRRDLVKQPLTRTERNMLVQLERGGGA